jgi:hypothetical protein
LDFLKKSVPKSFLRISLIGRLKTHKWLAIWRTWGSVTSISLHANYFTTSIKGWNKKNKIRQKRKFRKMKLKL